MNNVRITTDWESIDFEHLRQVLIDDDFSNGRTTDEYRRCAAGSALNVYALKGEEIVGNARLFSDGVCNAYIMDVWTRSDLRRQGIGRAMMQRLLDECDGQHVYLFTEDMQPFYETLGFDEEHVGMSLVVGSWLRRP